MWSPAYAERPNGSVTGFLSYLDAAAVVENGLAPADVTVSKDRVQVMTVHAAKGLEWQIVGVPHLTARIFPSTASTRTWLTDAADLPPLLRGDRSADGVLGVPVLDTSTVTNRKQLSDTINAHRRQLEQRRVDEERRLLYVAITRAEDTLLLSGHHWGPSAAKPSGPSVFLTELKAIIDRSAADGDPCGVIEHWAPAPADGDRNPLRDEVVEAVSGRPIRSGRAAPTSNAGPRSCTPPPKRRPTPTTTPTAGWPTSTRCSPSDARESWRRSQCCRRRFR